MLSSLLTGALPGILGGAAAGPAVTSKLGGLAKGPATAAGGIGGLLTGGGIGGLLHGADPSALVHILSSGAGGAVGGGVIAAIVGMVMKNK